mgnify:FL=1
MLISLLFGRFAIGRPAGYWIWDNGAQYSKFGCKITKKFGYMQIKSNILLNTGIFIDSFDLLGERSEVS